MMREFCWHSQLFGWSCPQTTSDSEFNALLVLIFMESMFSVVMLLMPTKAGVLLPSTRRAASVYDLSPLDLKRMICLLSIY